MGLCPEGVPAHSLLPTSEVPVGALGSAAAWPYQLSPSSSVCHIQHALSVTNCFDSCPQLGDFVVSCVLFHLLLSVWSRRELGREEAAMGGTRLLLSLTPEQLPSAEGVGRSWGWTQPQVVFPIPKCRHVPSMSPYTVSPHFSLCLVP